MPIAPPPVIRGLEAKAEQAADGTWTIRDVPLFAEHVGRSARTGKPVPVDRAWLTKCVAQQQAEYAENGYLPTLHINHHDFGNDPVEHAGAFLPTRVGVARTRTGKVLAIYGDLVGIAPAVFARIQAKALPYLSCEVDLDAARLETCALLPTRPPVHKFSPLTIGSARTSARNSLRAPAEVVAYASSPGLGARILSRIPAPMTSPDETKKDGAPAPTAKCADGAPAPAAPAATPAPAPDLGAKLDALATAIQTLTAMVAKSMDSAEDDAPGEPAPVNGTGSTAYAEKVGELGGKIAALETKVAEREKADTSAAAIAKTRLRLARYGTRIASLDKDLADHYALGGEPALAKYAEFVEKNLPPVGAGSTLDGVGGSGGESAVALPKDLLAKYAASGPDELAQIAKYSAQYDACGGQRTTQMSRVDFVATEVRLAERAAALA